VKTLGSACLGAACIALLLAPSAQAHRLTVKRARAALKPVAAETAPQMQLKLAAKLPGATLKKAGVGPCRITKRGHRADCLLLFDFTGALAGGPIQDEVNCQRAARVELRGKRSQKLKISLLGQDLFCSLAVPLDI
jgi:hypothetical protein